MTAFAAGHAVRLAVRDREKDHRYPVGGTALLRAETEPIGKSPVGASVASGLWDNGGRRCRGVTRGASGARSTPANPPRKGPTRRSTRSRPRATPATAQTAA